MDNNTKIQAIQGILNDFRDKIYFLMSVNSKENLSNDTVKNFQLETIKSIKKIIDFEG